MENKSEMRQRPQAAVVSVSEVPVMSLNLLNHFALEVPPPACGNGNLTWYELCVDKEVNKS